MIKFIRIYNLYYELYNIFDKFNLSHKNLIVNLYSLQSTKTLFNGMDNTIKNIISSINEDKKNIYEITYRILENNGFAKSFILCKHTKNIKKIKDVFINMNVYKNDELKQVFIEFVID